MRLLPLFVATMCCSFAALAAEAPSTAVPTRVAVHAARLFDVDSGRVLRDHWVLVELGDTTLLPGLIDVHITGDATASSGNHYRDILAGRCQRARARRLRDEGRPGGARTGAAVVRSSCRA